MITARASRHAEAAERRVLVVDDEASIRDAIARFLRARGFEVVGADTVADALQRLRNARFGAVLCDVRMPGTSGMDLVPAARELDPDVAILMLTALNDAPTATEALAQGASDYLLKPIELDRLEAAITHALARRREMISRRASAPSGAAPHDQARNDRDTRVIRNAAEAALEAVVTFVESKDPYRTGHAQRVAALAVAIGEVLGVGADAAAILRRAGLLHDVGNVAVPETLLLKPAPLDHDERERVRAHVGVSLQILATLPHLAPMLPAVRDHHERWDGAGYPDGVAGDAIAMGARILAAADAFAAVTAGRPYAPSLPPGDALAYLAPSAGSHFDPAVFRALEQVVTRKHR